MPINNAREIVGPICEELIFKQFNDVKLNLHLQNMNKFEDRRISDYAELQIKYYNSTLLWVRHINFYSYTSTDKSFNQHSYASFL